MYRGAIDNVNCGDDSGDKITAHENVKEVISVHADVEKSADERVVGDYCDIMNCRFEW